ncbi:MAG: sigma-70 family RNA polymerase sigma factor [Alphaproteobacteria bacterium]|nr:sigma-70 family RNA polymerase sigma factor [Alphaproteobacteria bacterium]
MAPRPALEPHTPPGLGAASAEPTDDGLIARAGRGDRAAWNALVARHLPDLVALGWYVLADRGEAEDVAQEAFLRLVRKVDTWEPGGAQLKTWLHRVAVNLCIDRKRIKRAAREPLDSDAAMSVAAPDALEAFDRRRAVARALRAIPERQRAAVVLVYYQGFSNKEAAHMLDVGLEALESLLSRARRALKERLKHVIDDIGVAP